MVLAAGPFGLGPMELVIILLVLVMLFGASRLSELGGSLGKGIKEFKKNINEDSDASATAPPPPVVRAAAPPAAGPHTVAAVQCPSCGALNPVGAKHCTQCGTAITVPVS